MQVKLVSKTVLKTKMFEYFRRVERSGKEIIVTDHNIPVLKITPLNKRQRTVEEVFGKPRKKVKYFADLTEPTEDEWSEV
jgi:prevent-host-death family protein